MSTRPELSYDGCGINGPDEYRSRVATFTEKADRKKYGPMFAASPKLLAALKGVQKWWTETPGEPEWDEMPAEIFDQMNEAIADAEGRTPAPDAK